MNGKQLSQQLKNYAVKYGLNEKVVYPHSFRHRYAKNFLEKFNDIALLADLMGHESIETNVSICEEVAWSNKKFFAFLGVIFRMKSYFIFIIFHLQQISLFLESR